MMMVRKDRLYKIVLALTTAALVGATALPVEAADTTVSQTITPGLLTLTAPATAALPPVPVSAGADSTSEGSLGTMQVADNRGTSAGWTLTASLTDFNLIATPVPSRPNSPTLVSSGTYTGSQNGQYIVAIIRSGTLGTAKYQIAGLESPDETFTVPADGNASIGGQGVSVHFGPGTYQQGDTYTIGTAQISASNATITPANITAINGSLSNIEVGGELSFSDPSSPALVMGAESGSGFGIYSATPILRLVIPARSPSGVYTATLTETLD